MRIIAGEFRGRRIQPPPGSHVRPTADRVREAWFSILGDAVPGATVLDLFAGSGALGLEALSRGAAHVTFVELSPPSLQALRGNIATLGVADRVTVHRGDALRFVDRLPERAFDVAFADPPYTTGQAAGLSERFRNHPFAAVLGIEHQSTVALDGGRTRRYGSVAITFFHAP
jgi:16S rRNA (guanine966-N2)-methyltransferase